MTGRRREAQRIETRRLVLEAACASFEEVGYERTTMRAVAEAAGVAVGTIFSHFPDKSALLSAAFHDELEAVVQEAFASLPDAPLAERFLHLAQRLYAFYGRRPRLSRVLVAHGLLLDETEQGPLLTQARSFLDALADLAKQAKEKGELRPQVDPMEAALALWADYLAVLTAGLRTAGMASEQQLELLERLVTLRMEGIGG